MSCAVPLQARHFPSVMPHQRHPPLPIMPNNRLAISLVPPQYHLFPQIQGPTRHRLSNDRLSMFAQPPDTLKSNSAQTMLSTLLIRFVIDHTCSDTNRISHANVAATKLLMWHANMPMVHPDLPHRQRHQDPTTIVTTQTHPSDHTFQCHRLILKFLVCIFPNLPLLYR